MGQLVFGLRCRHNRSAVHNVAAVEALGWVGENEFGPRFGKGVNPGGRASGSQYTKMFPGGITAAQASREAQEFCSAAGFGGYFGYHCTVLGEDGKCLNDSKGQPAGRSWLYLEAEG